MKRIFLGGLIFTLLIFCLPGLIFGQSAPVNIHQYSTDILTQDSGGVVFTYPVLITGLDKDTSESFDLSTFNRLTSIHKFSTDTDVDSLAVGIQLAVTLDDTTWSVIDSIAHSAITAALLVVASGTDSAYVKNWTTVPGAKKGRFYYQGTLKTGYKVWIRTKIFKQR